MTTHYETLGLAKDASSADVKRAFRRAIRDAHPDQGGSQDQAAAVNKAYEVLSDPELRAMYDAGADAPDTAGLEAEAMQCLVDCFRANLMAETGQFISRCSGLLRKGTVAAESALSGLLTEEVKLTERRNKVKAKPGVDNVLHVLIDDRLRQIKGESTLHQRSVKVFAMAGTLLEGYTSEEQAMDVFSAFRFSAHRTVAEPVALQELLGGVRIGG